MLKGVTRIVLALAPATDSGLEPGGGPEAQARINNEVASGVKGSQRKPVLAIGIA